MGPQKQSRILENINAEISKVVVGKEGVTEILLSALLAQGHVLVEGLPGTGKTSLGRSFAQAIGGTFKRIQGTPDMLPADILGFNYYHPDGRHELIMGPIFANVVLADELNRTTSRTQSAFLEAMQEQQVTIERETFSLEKPFIVIASQIPYGDTGTFMLSDVQMDRFMFCIRSTMPSPHEEEQILRDIDIISEPHIAPATSPEEIISLQQAVKKVHVADEITRYIVEILNCLRNEPDLLDGPSPRGSIALFRGIRALAFVQDRDFAIPDDVKRLLKPTLLHRLRVRAEAKMDDVDPEHILDKIIAAVPVPKVSRD